MCVCNYAYVVIMSDLWYYGPLPNVRLLFIFITTNYTVFLILGQPPLNWSCEMLYSDDLLPLPVPYAVAVATMDVMYALGRVVASAIPNTCASLHCPSLSIL